jgi:CHAP domain
MQTIRNLQPTKEALDLFSFGLLRSQLGVRESTKNTGPAVELYQRAVTKRGERSGGGSAVGEAWCAAFVHWVIFTAEHAFNTRSRVTASELAVATFTQSPKELRLTKPEAGSLIVWRKKGTSNGHIEWVVDVNADGTVQTIGGNTGPDVASGVNDAGDGVYWKRQVAAESYGDMEFLGFLRVWENAA